MVKGKAWFRIKDPPVGEGQVGQMLIHTISQYTQLKEHLIEFFICMRLRMIQFVYHHYCEM